MDKDKKTIKEKYVEAIGRRKTSTARVRIWQATKSGFIVNRKEVREYFKNRGTASFGFRSGNKRFSWSRKNW
ncbi:MAG: 30S ribosomal protein S9 [Candidatus Nomurabacteria bacterium]|nr:30S ribosomal protein S9 [Candidatus Nomurabacteria bacterium]